MITQKQGENYNLKYALCLRCFDSGRIETWIEPCDPGCRDTSRDRGNYVFYFTVFDTENEAIDYQQGCLAARF